MTHRSCILDVIRISLAVRSFTSQYSLSAIDFPPQHRLHFPFVQLSVVMLCCWILLGLLSLRNVVAPNTIQPCTDVQLTNMSGRWVPLDQPRYGGRCPWMKARYNCEGLNYRHLRFVPTKVEQGECTLPPYTPISAARARMARLPDRPPGPVTMVVLGDSHVRQHVHALGCQFAHQVCIALSRIRRSLSTGDRMGRGCGVLFPPWSGDLGRWAAVVSLKCVL